MSAPPDVAALTELVRGRGVLAHGGVEDARVVWARGGSGGDRLVDGDVEHSVEEHRAAHAGGRPSEAAVRYGAGVAPDVVARRLLALGALARETGLLMAVCPVPGEGDSRRPGSWGLEDLGVVRAARLALPESVRIRPHWRLLGPAACQVAVAFGADEWILPEGDATDPRHLAEAVGARAVER